MRTRQLAGLAAAAVAALTLTAPSQPAQASAPVRKVLVVGMDGLNWAKVVEAEAPTLDGLAAAGTLGHSLLYCPSVASSSSGPGWSTIASGVWPDKHGVKDNSFAGKQYGTYPDFLTRLERADPAYHTLSILDWAVLHTQGTFGSAIDTRITYDGDANGYVGEDEKVTVDAVSRLRDTDVDAAFVYLGNTDVVAHASGTGASYVAAIEKQDAQLKQMLDAIEARPTYAGEDWLIVVTTDHGHHVSSGGHGGCGINDERRTWILARGAGHSAGLRPTDTRLVDVASTVFAHLGVAVDPAWNLDGKPVGVRSTDPFDTLTLRSRADETGIPASVLGWTPTGPSGWSVDRSKMPSGGVTEWRGWSFTNDEFWSRTDSGQNRENGLRLRGVFAVADSDEFADLSGGTSYDSTLTSPAYAVTAGGTVSVRYVTHYLQEGSQTGDVMVSFDGGPDQLVKRYSSDARAKVESLNVTVPSGATSMRVKFRYYNAANNWYWAIDDLRVGAATGTAGPIVNSGSDRCVDVPGSNTADGTQLVLWDCHAGPNQTWALRADGTIRSLGKCMDVNGGSSANGTAVQLYTCNGTAAQRWTYDPGTRHLQSLGKCLDASGAGTANGTKLIIWTCHTGANQQWMVPS